MANVKTIGGSVVNTAGVALVSKTATLKNDDTGATITTTTTNADGEWEFANRDETIRYRVDAAFGGSSSQVVVRKPASAEFDHLYANLSFRSAAGAVVAIAGPMTVLGGVGLGGALSVAGAVTLLGPVSLSGGVSGDLAVTGAATIAGALTVNGATSLGGTLAVTVGGATRLSVSGSSPHVFVDGNASVDGNLSTLGLLYSVGPLTVDGATSLGDTLAVGGDTTVAGLLSAGARILVDGGSLATPEIACISDPDTGVVFNGGNQMTFGAGGNEVARVWMNGANSQFSTYGAETYIGTTKLMLGGVMTAAASVTGVVRKIQIHDAAGAAVGWVPVYGATG